MLASLVRRLLSAPGLRLGGFQPLTQHLCSAPLGSNGLLSPICS
jgi:hypothetical protein